MATVPSPSTATVLPRRTFLPSRTSRSRVEGVRQGLVAGDARRHGLPGADADEDGVEAGLHEAVRVDVAAEQDVVDEAYAGVPQRLQLGVQHLFRQAEAGDAVAQHAARLLRLVVDGDRVAGLRQEPGAAQAGRAGADDGHPLAGARRRGQSGRGVVAGGAVQGADGDRLVDLAAPAGRLAGPRADAPEDAREGQLVAHGGRGGGEVAAVDELDVGGDVDVRRAGDRAGRLAVGVVVGEVHAQVAGALGAHPLGVRLHDHAVCHPRGAGGLQLAPALDLDEAEAASAPGGHALFVAERRDLYAGATSGAQHRLAARRRDGRPLMVRATEVLVWGLTSTSFRPLRERRCPRRSRRTCRPGGRCRT